MKKQKEVFIHKVTSLSISMLVLIALLVFVTSYHNEVTFSDPGLESAIRDRIGKQNGKIIQSEVRKIRYLDASNRNILNLWGIENLTKLEGLNLEGNRVNDLTPLESIRKLNDLNLRNNEIISLNEINFHILHSLPLRRLNLRHNQVWQVDGTKAGLTNIVPVEGLNYLEILDLRDNLIEDISSLGNLVTLKELDLRDNLIKDITPLKNLVSLRELNLRENPIYDLSPLHGLIDLNYLNIHSVKGIESINPLANLRQLQTLIMPNIPIGNELMYISNLSNLKRLNIRNCGISDLSVIADLISNGAFTNIQTNDGLEASLDISENPIHFYSYESYLRIKNLWEKIEIREPYWLAHNCIIDPPQFSTQAGFYTESFDLEIFHNDPDVIILYTLDGSEPEMEQINSSHKFRKTHIYNGPINIKSRKGEPNLFSEIKTTGLVYDWLPEWSSPIGEVFKANIIRVRAVKSDSIFSCIETASFFVDSQIDSRYMNIPVVSLVSDYRDLFDPNTGMYVPGSDQSNILKQNFFKEWKRTAHIDFFDIQRSNGFNGSYEISLQGHTSKTSPQKGLHVIAKENIGDSLIHYPIFNNSQSNASNLNQYKRFMIRAWGSARGWPVFFTDAYNQMLVAKSGLDIQSYRPAILYINGEYWGIHELREANKNSWYYHFHYGLNPVNPGLDIIYEWDEPNEGTVDNWNKLWSIIRSSDLSDASNYQQIAEMLDIENLIHYIIHSTYLGKRDWPVQNEAKWRPRKSNGKWRFIQFDMDQGMDGWSNNKYNMIEHVVKGSGRFEPHLIFIKLLENDEFKKEFLNTFADWMNSIFSTRAEMALFDSMAAELEPYIKEFTHRWPIGYDWESGLDYGRDIILKRQDFRIQQLNSFFNLKDLKITLDITDHEHGYIRINSLKINDSTQGIDVNPYPWSGTYFSGIPIELEAIPKDGYRFIGWKEIQNNRGGTLSKSDDFFSTDQFIKQNFEADAKLIAVFEPL